MRKPTNQQTIETALEALYTTPEPATDFVTRLEAQLLSQQQVYTTVDSDRPTGMSHWLQQIWLSGRRPLLHQRLVAAALLITLLLVVTLSVIGPRRVLAALQNWIGYVPGIGFVALENTRLLTTPIGQTRDGITLRVEQLIAKPEETVLLFSSVGLSPLAETGYDTEELPAPQLRLPDGTTLLAEISQLSYGRGHYTFPPLPANVYHVRLLLPRLPLVPADIAPENWEVSLTLQPADGTWVADLFPQPYEPVGAEVTHNDVTLRVVGVAHAAGSTAIRTQVTWADPAWQHYDVIGGRYLPILRDDLGHIYQYTHENSSSVAVMRVVEETDNPSLPERTSEETITFAPVSPVAHELTLVLDALEFDIPTNDAFTVDLGLNPQVGDTFPLDVRLNVAGFPVHLTEARIAEVVERYHPDRIERPLHLVITTAPMAETGQRVLHGLHLEANGFNGSSTGYSFDENQLRSVLVLNEGSPIPSGVVDVQVTRASIQLPGPWQVSWTLPGSAESGIQLLTLHPDAVSTQNNVTVSVADMTLTDRVTAVQFHVTSNNGSGEIHTYAGLDSMERNLSLTDQSGRRYQLADWTVRWHPDGTHPGEIDDPNWVMFTPLNPLARQVTLSVPAVMVAVTETAVLELTLPATIALHPDENPMLPPRSDMWPINIPLYIVGYELLFSQAWLQEINPGQVLLILESEELPRPQNGRWLRQLHVGQVTGPDGLLPASDWTRGSAGLSDPPGIVRIVTSDGSAANGLEPSPTYRATLSVALGDNVTAGIYHIQLNRVSLQIDGPWSILVDLP